MFAVGGPRQGHVVHQLAQLVLAGTGTGLGKALQQALVGHANHTSVHRVVAVVVAVFLAFQAQNVVQPKFGTQQGGHLPRYGAGSLGANQAQVFACHTAQVAGVVQGTGQKVVVFQPALQAVGFKAFSLGFGHHAGALQQAIVVPALGGKVVAGLPRCAVAFDAVGQPQRQRLVVQAVVQRLRERQNVLNLHLVAQRRPRADEVAAVRATALQRVAGQFFPQDEFFNVGVAHTLDCNAQHRRSFGTQTLVAALVTGLALLFVLALFAALFQVAGHLNHHLGGVAVAAQQGIHHLAHLVQPNVDGRVGNTAKAFFGQIIGQGTGVGKANVARQVFAVIRQFGQYLARTGSVAQLAVVVKPGGLHRFVVSHHVAFQRGHNARQGSRTQAAVTFGQSGVGQYFGGSFVHAGVLLQPCHQRAFVFFGQQLHNHCILFWQTQFVPAQSAQQLGFAQNTRSHIAFEFLALFILMAERRAGGQFEQRFDLGKREFGLALQFGQQQVALCQRQGFIRLARALYAQMVQLLQHAEALLAGQCQRGALFFRQQGAAPRTHWAQFALKQQAIFQAIACCVVELGRIVLSLTGPQRIKFGLDHGAVNVEVVHQLAARQPIVFGAHGVAVLHALPQQFAHGAGFAIGAQRVDGLAHMGNGGFECAGIAGTLVGFTVAFKTAPLVHVEQSPTKLGWGQGAAQPFGTQLVGVEPFQRLAFCIVCWKKIVCLQQFQHACLAPQQTVTAAAHSAGFAARDRQRRTVFRVAPIAKNPHTGTDQCHGLVVVVDSENGPPQRCTAQIKRQSVPHISSLTP